MLLIIYENVLRNTPIVSKTKIPFFADFWRKFDLLDKLSVITECHDTILNAVVVPAKQFEYNLKKNYRS